MENKYFAKVVTTISFIITTSFFVSCSWIFPAAKLTEMDQFQEFIIPYHEVTLSENTNDKRGNQAIYVDFSDGMVQAYSSETNKKLIDYFCQKMVGNSIDWFGLGKNHNGIGKISFTDYRDIYNKVISDNSYVDIMAPIEEALKKITASKNDAILITDFEEYTPDGKEQKYAYAKDYFTKWVQAGNSISIFYSKYHEKNSKTGLEGDKNLYFVIFNYGEIEDNSLLTKFNKAIEGRGAGLIDLKKFEINPNPFIVSNNYGGNEKTGLTPDDIKTTELSLGDKSEVLTYYHNGLIDEKKTFEAFEFGLSLNDLHEYYFKEKKRFSQKLYLDVSNDKSYILNEVEVRVSDITPDYIHFVKCERAKNMKPELDRDEGGNTIWSKKDEENPEIVEYFEKNSSKLKKEYVYQKKSGSGEVIPEIFDYESNIFKDRLKNSPKEVELITIFHKNYNGKFAANDQKLLRIDYVVKNTSENYSNQLEDFKWNSIINSSNGVNSSLFESIRNTLQEVKPSGILYSYYLKLEPNSKK